MSATEPASTGLARLHPRLRAVQLPVVISLTVIWVLLWGDPSVGNVVGGLLVAVVVCIVFPLPPLHMALRVRPVWLGWLIVRFLFDVVVASVDVAYNVLRLRRQPKNAVIAVTLRTPSDFVLTVVAEMVSLIPGSLVVEVRRSDHTFFLHVLDAKDAAGVERMREQVYILERRVVRAFGARTDHLDTPLADQQEASP